jgi:hypothetical protein
MPGQKGWTGPGPKQPKTALGSETKKRGGQPLPHLKRPGVGQNELASGPEVLLTTAAFFLPLLRLFEPRQLALKWQCPD